MGLIELLIVVLLVLWLTGYVGRGRVYARGPIVSTAWYTGSVVHTLLVISLILVILRLLRVL